MKREPHYLKENKSTSVPSRVIFVDTETDQIQLDDNKIEQRLKMGVACYKQYTGNKQKAREDWITFTTKDEFWSFVLEHMTSRRRVLLVAHNLDFDLLVLDGFHELEKRGFELRDMISTSGASIITFSQYDEKYIDVVDKDGKINKKRVKDVIKTLLCLDNMNFFHMSLKALGESIGSKKLDIDFNTCTPEELEIYNKQDVQIMIDAWDKWLLFIADNDLGTWAKTCAGQSFNAFRHRFMKHEIFIHDDARAIALEREAYHGGRTEAHFIGEITDRTYHIADVNSMYPYVMQKYDYPTYLLSYMRNATIEDIKYHIKEYCLIARVGIETTENVFAAHIDKRLCFPTGRFETVLTTPELVYAIDHNMIEYVADLAIYAKGKIFTDFVTFFYGERLKAKKKGDKAYTLLFKLLMNSLYGKFGQQIDEYENVEYNPNVDNGFWTEYDAEDACWRSYRCVGGLVSEVKGKCEGYNSMVAIPAHVTAYARLYLYELMCIVGRENYIYSDTDSLFVTDEGLEKLKPYLHKSQLGMLDVEKTSNYVRIFGAKDYIFGDKVKHKGINKTATKIGEATWQQYQQRSIKGAMREGNYDKCIWKQTEKTLKREYKKGEVQPGGTVTPHRLE